MIIEKETREKATGKRISDAEVNAINAEIELLWIINDGLEWLRKDDD